MGACTGCKEARASKWQYKQRQNWAVRLFDRRSSVICGFQRKNGTALNFGSVKFFDLSLTTGQHFLMKRERDGEIAITEVRKTSHLSGGRDQKGLPRLRGFDHILDS